MPLGGVRQGQAAGHRVGVGHEVATAPAQGGDAARAERDVGVPEGQVGAVSLGQGAGAQGGGGRLGVWVCGERGWGEAGVGGRARREWWVSGWARALSSPLISLSLTVYGGTQGASRPSSAARR